VKAGTALTGTLIAVIFAVAAPISWRMYVEAAERGRLERAALRRLDYYCWETARALGDDENDLTSDDEERRSAALWRVHSGRTLHGHDDIALCASKVPAENAATDCVHARDEAQCVASLDNAAMAWFVRFPSQEAPKTALHKLREFCSRVKTAALAAGAGFSSEDRATRERTAAAFLNDQHFHSLRELELCSSRSPPVLSAESYKLDRKYDALAEVAYEVARGIYLPDDD